MSARRRSATTSTASRNAAALSRAQAAAEQGKVAEYDEVRRLWLVPSLSGRNRARYQVHVLAHLPAGLAGASCTCEAGHTQAPQGSSPCWHGAAALVEAQLLGLVCFDGSVWLLSGVGRQLAEDEAARQPSLPPVSVDPPEHRRPLLTSVKPGTEEYERMVEGLVG